MNNKTVLVTGGGRGIGRAIAIKFAEEGYNVAINYNGNEAASRETEAACIEKGAKTLVIKCDVADNQGVKAMVDAVVDHFGTLDVLVNNAGITEDGLILRMREDAFDRVVEVNLKGTFNCTQHAAKVMLKKRSGKIINMASVVALSGNAGQANYAASKAGIIALTKTTAKEFASRNITANAIAPGFIESDMSGALSESIQKEILSQILVKRFGKTHEVAELAAFLASDKSDYITGQVFCIDGGMSI